MNSPSFLRSVSAIGLPLAALATVILAISYVNDQQGLRAAANEPQEYIVRDAALRVLASGGIPSGGFPNAIPIETDPSPYVVFYDATGKPVAGTGLLHGAPPTLPEGVFTAAKRYGVNRLTWQPEQGVRQALVVLPAGEGYVVSGRSLTYTEEQEASLTKRSLWGWFGAMALILITVCLGVYLLRKRTRA